jgi:putative transposase
MPIVEEESPRHGIAHCCRTLEVPRASFYRWRHRRRHPALARRRPTPARAYTARQREEILAVVNGERFRDLSVPEVLYTCLEEGRYLASRSTVYRFLKRDSATRERRDQLSHPVYARPELFATGPNQVWSWDITKLRGPVKWVYFYLYVLLDIFSRYVVGWLIAHRESARIASVLLADSCRRHEIAPGQLSIHADRGSSMRSKTIAQLFDDLQVLSSFSRPHVSNDNPFSEAQFKTMKYQPGYPPTASDRFKSRERLAGASCPGTTTSITTPASPGSRRPPSTSGKPTWFSTAGTPSFSRPSGFIPNALSQDHQNALSFRRPSGSTRRSTPRSASP